MTDRLTCHDMEMLCRRRSVLESADRAKWLAEAEGCVGLSKGSRRFSGTERKRFEALAFTFIAERESLRALSEQTTSANSTRGETALSYGSVMRTLVAPARSDCGSPVAA
jgi:hypothetical protein